MWAVVWWSWYSCPWVYVRLSRCVSLVSQLRVHHWESWPECGEPWQSRDWVSWDWGDRRLKP